jgi:hypothetical protein
VRLARVSAILGLAAIACLIAPTTAAGQSPLQYVCFPAPNNCAAWYTQPVDLVWDWNNTEYMATGGTCYDQRFTQDTQGTRVECEITHRFSGARHAVPVTIYVDRTLPSVSATPARPPDYNGWYNHPVGVAFTGADATSGLHSCTSAGYGGPDAAGVVVGGSCRDVAGNVGQSSFALNYDATPPATPKVTALPNDHRVKLSWAWPADAEIVELARLTADGLPALLYRGGDRSFTDTKLRNGRRHRYILTAIDRAGNRSADTASAVPTGLRLLSPARGARVKNPPLLIWEPVKRARYYNVQLFRGRRKVLTRWPRGERLQLTKVWRFGDGRRRLKPGRYTWFVFPGFGERSQRRYGKVLGESSFRVVR